MSENTNNVKESDVKQQKTVTEEKQQDYIPPNCPLSNVQYIDFLIGSISLPKNCCDALYKLIDDISALCKTNNIKYWMDQQCVIEQQEFGKISWNPISHIGIMQSSFDELKKLLSDMTNVSYHNGAIIITRPIQKIKSAMRELYEVKLIILGYKKYDDGLLIMTAEKDQTDFLETIYRGITHAVVEERKYGSLILPFLVVNDSSVINSVPRNSHNFLIRIKRFSGGYTNINIPVKLLKEFAS